MIVLSPGLYCFSAPTWQAKREWNHTDLLYSGICADGSCIPPVIITSDRSVPEGVEDELDAFVVYCPGIKKPSAKTTLIYFDKVREYFNRGDHIIWDRGTEFQNKKVREHVALMGVYEHTLPTGGGAFCNPNDNSFFSQVEGAYKRLVKTSHVAAIRAILNAYRIPSEEHIRHYFSHCLLRNKAPKKVEVRSLVNATLRMDNRSDASYASMKAEYLHYVKNDRQLSPDVRRLSLPFANNKHTLDGHYWNKYSS